MTYLTGYFIFTVNHTALWWLNSGPVGGVLSASSSILASTSLPPSRSLSLHSFPSLLPPLLTVYQVHHPLTPHFALENSAPLAHTQTLSAHARQHLVSEIRNLRHQRVRLLSPCYLAWSTWPRVQRGAREQRGGVETRVGGEKKRAQEQKKSDKDAEDDEMKEEERQMGPERGREKGRETQRA